MSWLQSCEALSIVVVDDELSFRTSLSEMLRDDGHRVLEYGDPATVPETLSLPGLALLVTAYDMPGQNGLVVAEGFRRAHPTVPALILTSYDSEALAHVTRGRPFVRLVQRPIAYDRLHAMIHQVGAHASA
ncbi:MAG: response regulator [Candidatus Binatia bacterium]